jgi:hopanoid C-3 methylase
VKILLIQPPKPEVALGGEDFSIFEPLALEYLAAAVERSHEIRILDMRLEPDLDAVLDRFRPRVVGLTAYTVHVNTVKTLSRRIKAFDPAITVIVGGHHATVMPEDFRTASIDVVVAGEGVGPFREVISRLERHQPLGEIPDAVCLETGGIVINQTYSGFDLDALPFPRRDLTAAYRDSYFSEWMKPLASIRTSMGCCYRCCFCALWKLTGGRYLARTPERIVEELRTITEKYVFFADDESLLDTERMRVLADLITQAGISKRYFVYGRSDTIVRHPELLEQWKGIGLERVFVGLECIRDADLKSIRKGSTVAYNVAAVKILKRLGLDIWPMFIVRPDFTRQDFADLCKYCRELEFEFIGFSVLTPLPGTDLYREAKHRLITCNYDFFDFFHTLLPTSLPKDRFYRELVILFRRSRSLRNQMRLLLKYPVRELPPLFRAYAAFMKRLQRLAGDYTA